MSTIENYHRESGKVSNLLRVTWLVGVELEFELSSDFKVSIRQRSSYLEADLGFKL